MTSGPLNVCEIMGLCELQLTGEKIIIIWGNEVCLYEDFVIWSMKRRMGKCFVLKVPKCLWHSKKTYFSY